MIKVGSHKLAAWWRRPGWRHLWSAVAVGGALIGSPVLAAEPPTITIFAAASLTNALQDIAAQQSEQRWRLSFASSSVLAKQIQAGGPADIYISANEVWMDHLITVDAIRPNDRVNLLSNRLALIAPADSDLAITVEPGFALARALGDGWLAMGDPDHVPAGIYAKQALTHLGVWASVARKVAPMHNVRAALNLVARGEAAIGIVYTTDALITDRVRTLALVPTQTHDTILYSAAIVTEHDRPAVRRAFEILRSGATARLFAKHGFAVPPGRSD